MNDIKINVAKVGVSEIIDMAWCDKTSFDDIEKISGYSEQQVIDVMKRNVKPSSFRLWRKRVSGRAAKHDVLKKNKSKSENINIYGELGGI